MSRGVWAFAILALGFPVLPSCGQQQASARTADMCSLVQAPQKWAGGFVKVRARLVRLKTGEWAIHDTCWPPVLLVQPDELTPPAGFVVSPDSDMAALRRAESEYVSLVGLFEGRVDWSGESSQSVGKKERNRKLFGKAKLPVRLVLRRISDCTIVDVPYK